MIIALGSFSVGQIMAYSSPTNIPMGQEFGLSSSMLTFFNILAPLAAFFGGFVSKATVSRFGRKTSTFIFGAITFVTWFILALTPKSIYWLAYVIRAIQGVCFGSVLGICGMYIIEISPTEYRGSYGTIHQFFICIGASYTYALGIFFSWRTLTFLSTIFTGIHLVLIWYVPDSHVVEDNNEDQEPLFQMKYLKPNLHLLALNFFQQFSGINAIMTNLSAIFIESKVTLAPAVCALLVSLSQVITSGIASPIVESLGRKPTWVISAVGQFLSLLFEWAHITWNIHPILPLICLFMDVLFFGLGFGPITWIVVPELYPDSVRSTASTYGAGLNNLLASSVMFIWPIMKNSIGMGWGFFIFSIICLSAGVYGQYYMPETKGASLGEVDNEDSNHSNDDKEQKVPIELD